MDRRTVRAAFFCTVVVASLPFVWSLAIPAEGSRSVSQEWDADDRERLERVTFISEQGRVTRVDPHAGRLIAVHTPTGDVVWEHEEYRRYMDVDVLDRDTVLVVAGDVGSDGVVRRAVVLDWREGTELTSFVVPPDTHDVDHLGDGRYAVADKKYHRAYVYDASNDSVVWEYEFSAHYEPPENATEKDWTHLNDIDPVLNGSAFLLSPRNFDTVVVVNRTTKEYDYRLGERGDRGTVYEQHNPDLIGTEPPTLLVADSENNRVVEYQLDGTEWTPIWGMEAGLDWPRDADRLENGNTLITDSRGDRVVEVTPNGTVVWEFETDRRPYDAERLGTAGGEPTAERFRMESVPRDPSPIDPKHAYNLAGWFLPISVSYVDFVAAGVAGIVAVIWGLVEVGWAVKARDRR